MKSRSIVVLKVGGDLAIQPELVESVCNEIANLTLAGFCVVLVHGGGPQLDQALKKRGRSSTRVAGRRVTSISDLELAVQVWRGELSVAWVSGLGKQGISACGVCGADGFTLQAHRRPKTAWQDDDGTLVTVDFGFVGDLDEVETSLLFSLIDAGIVPVISPLAIDPSSGQMLNINADTVASEVSSALKADWLVLLSSIPGLLRDVRNPDSKISKLAIDEIPSLIETGVITGGMRPKVTALQTALESGVQRVILLDGRAAQLCAVLIEDQTAGTEVFNPSRTVVSVTSGFKPVSNNTSVIPLM